MIPHYSSTWGYCIVSSKLLPVINREFLFKNVEKNPKPNMCFLQQLTSKQETSTHYQGKLQVCAAERASQHQDAAQYAPQERGRLQLKAGHNALQYQRKNRDLILSNEDL